MLGSALTNVSLGTADILAYAMLVMVVVFLTSGPIVLYYYRKKAKRMKPVAPRAS